MHASETYNYVLPCYCQATSSSAGMNTKKVRVVNFFKNAQKSQKSLVDQNKYENARFL